MVPVHWRRRPRVDAVQLLPVWEEGEPAPMARAVLVKRGGAMVAVAAGNDEHRLGVLKGKEAEAADPH